jgi:hypothetical protein
MPPLLMQPEVSTLKKKKHPQYSEWYLVNIQGTDVLKFVADWLYVLEGPRRHDPGLVLNDDVTLV